MNLNIRVFQESDPISEITTLLHRAYKPLADAGLKYLASHQDDAQTMSRIRAGQCFLLLSQDRIVGTITNYLPNTSRIDWPLIYQEQGIAHFGQFAVEPHLQKQGLGSMLMDHVERFARSEGSHTICFDTAESAVDLINYYEKRGYSFATYHQWEMTNYRSIIMKKSL